MIQNRIKNNRTVKYLGPLHVLYGKTFLKEVDNLTNYVPAKSGSSIIDFTIMDLLYYRAKRFKKFQPFLFITFDSKGAYDERKGNYADWKTGRIRFLNFLSYVRKNAHYVDDYWDVNNQHVIVMKCPIEKPFYEFVKSAYSKMYSTPELKELGFTPTIKVGGKNYPSASWVVLTKNQEYGHQVLKSNIEEAFGVTAFPEEPDEFDIYWTNEQEIRNYQFINPEEYENLVLAKKGQKYVLQN